jgi:hypothetical protein
MTSRVSRRTLAAAPGVAAPLLIAAMPLRRGTDGNVEPYCDAANSAMVVVGAAVLRVGWWVECGVGVRRY